MARTKLVVETPYGTATRVSERPYAFVIVSRGQTVAYQESRNAQARQSHLDIAAKYERWIAKAVNGVYHEVYNGGYGHADHTVEKLTEYAANARELADVPGKIVEPAGRFVVHGWSQSSRGAAKFVADAQKYGYTEILVVPVK